MESERIEMASLLKSESVHFSWQNISVTVPQKTAFLTRKKIDEIQILRKGSVRPGTLLAIMGASGSGKTTLLNALTCRLASDLDTSGDLYVNGKKVKSEIHQVSAYVRQDDLFIGTLTVREHLWFQAMLRMDQKLSSQKKNNRVDEVIADIGLTKCKDSVIGIQDKVKSISGGERKRLSFASEILTNPALMFCDEPTSGLDSYMAVNVVQTLQNMARTGKTILCTIHQPSSPLFNLFDSVLLLARGRTAYLGDREGAVEFFASQGAICPSNFNPADFYINTLAVISGQEEECEKRIETICSAFDSSTQAKEVEEQFLNSSSNEKEESPGPGKFKTDVCNQFRYVLWRAVVATLRNRGLMTARFGQTIVIALFAGLLYLQQENTQRAVQNINGAIFLMLANMTFGNAMGVLTDFPLEIPVFKRDYQNGMYSTSVYYLSKSMTDLPMFTILPILFGTIMYWMVGFKEDGTAFLIFLGTTILMTHVVVGFGYLLSCVTGDASIAVALAGPLIVPFLLFGGIMVNDASVPAYFVWLQYLSWFKYSSELITVNQWHDFGEIGCEYGSKNHSLPQKVPEVPANFQRPPCVQQVPYSTNSSDMFSYARDLAGWVLGYSTSNQGYDFNKTGDCEYASSETSNPFTATSEMSDFFQNPPCFANGQQVLASLNYSMDNYTRDFAALAALLVGFRIVAFISLVFRVGAFPKFESRRKTE